MTESSGGHNIHIASQAAELCVSAFADVCAIYLRSAGPECAAFAHRSEEKFAALRALSYDDLYASRVKATGLAVLIEQPLAVANRRIGTLIVGLEVPSHERSVSPMVIELIASMLARAIEQAEELEHHYLISKRLQNALLPARLVSADDVVFDAAYRPASDEADVGGDWYDAFELANGKIGISVGDVTGHGLEAAVTMGELRRAIRAAAALNESPSVVLNQVDAVMCAEGLGMATAVAGIYDPATGVLRYATAGHPPPVLLAAGNANVLPAGGLLLGLGGSPASGDYVVTLTRGARCFFYTDGLLEYDRDVIAGEAALLAAIETIAERGDASAEELHREIFSRAVNVDDCATLTISRPAAERLMHEHLVFSALPMCAPLARHAVGQFCAQYGMSDEQTFDVLTAVGEAIANAIEHGERNDEHPFSINLAIKDGTLAVTIENFGHWRAFMAREERGRGIPMMRSCASTFEISSAQDRTLIRLTFPVR